MLTLFIQGQGGVDICPMREAVAHSISTPVLCRPDEGTGMLFLCIAAVKQRVQEGVKPPTGGGQSTESRGSGQVPKLENQLVWQIEELHAAS